MARQVLPLIDLRTAEQRRGLTSSQRNIQAITSILQTIGQAEQTRRERQQLDRVATAIANGATTIEAIAAAARQGPEFGTGFQGGLQKIGGIFQPSPGGGIGQNIQQSIIGAALKRALTPKPQIPPGLEPSGVKVGPKGGVTREWAPPKKTKIQELMAEGYTAKEAKEIRDILHGLKPRATAGKDWANLPLPEQLSKWQTIYQKTLDPAWGKLIPDLAAIQKTAVENINRINTAIKGQTQLPTGQQLLPGVTDPFGIR